MNTSTMIESSAAASVIAREKQHQIPGLQTIVTLSNLVIERGEGSYVWDVNGRCYLDFFTGVGINAIGHSHPHVIQAIETQLRKMASGPFYSPIRSDYVERLASHLPTDLGKLQFYSTGSEAVEAAIRLARSATGRFEIASFWGGFHGKTLGSLSLHGANRKQGWGPLLPGVHHLPFAHCYRCPVGASPQSCTVQCSDLAMQQFEASSAGSFAAIIIEPVQGTNGNIAPPWEFVERVVQWARASGALVIFDEVLTGFGRTGTMFALEQLSTPPPDIVVMGKAMGSGLPLSGIAASPELVASGPFTEPSTSSSTFGGNPLACAAGLATLEVIENEHAVRNAAVLGAEIEQRLNSWISNYEIVGNVHSRGLMIGIELVENKETKRALNSTATKAIFQQLVDRGLLAMAYGDRIRLYPPITISRSDLARGFDILEEVLALQR